MMNISVTSEFLCHTPFTGVEYYLYYLIQNLAFQKKVNLTVICPHNTPKKYIPPRTSIKTHSPVRIMNTNFISSLINPPKNLNKYDIIHCPTVVAPFFFRPKNASNTKIIMTVHDIIPILFPEFNILRRKIYFKYILKFRFQYVDHFIVPSMTTKMDLVKYFEISPNKIDVVYEGVSRKYKPKFGPKRDFILAVSTLEPRKNFGRVIESYIQLKEKFSIKEKLIIVGAKGWLYKNILNIPQKFNQDIIFKGYVPEDKLIELYQQAKLFVYPSLYEGFGLPVLEAMASGCPVVASNTSSIPEVAGGAAILTDPKNTELLSRAMLKVLRDDELREHLMKEGIHRSRQFSWKQCAKETFSVYKKVLRY